MQLACAPYRRCGATGSEVYFKTTCGCGICFLPWFPYVSMFFVARRMAARGKEVRSEGVAPWRKAYFKPKGKWPHYRGRCYDARSRSQYGHMLSARASFPLLQTRLADGMLCSFDHFCLGCQRTAGLRKLPHAAGLGRLFARDALLSTSTARMRSYSSPWFPRTERNCPSTGELPA